MEYKKEDDRVQDSKVISTQREKDHSDDGLNSMAAQGQRQ